MKLHKFAAQVCRNAICGLDGTVSRNVFWFGYDSMGTACLTKISYSMTLIFYRAVRLKAL